MDLERFLKEMRENHMDAAKFLVRVYYLPKNIRCILDSTKLDTFRDVEPHNGDVFVRKHICIGSFLKLLFQWIKIKIPRSAKVIFGFIILRKVTVIRLYCFLKKSIRIVES